MAGAATTVIFSIMFTITNFPRIESDTLRCYKCTMTLPSPYSNETARLCSNFDYSERYIVECPFSTLCMKKDFTVNLTTPINGTIRDCALQRYDYQNYKDGKWQLEVAIEEPYTEGCSNSNDKGFRNSRTQYCYCRGSLCNAATTPQSVLYFFTTISVIFVVQFRIS